MPEYSPSSHDCRPRGFFIGALDGLLRCEAPAGKVFAHTANVQFDAVLLFDGLTYGCAAPKKKIHLELIRVEVL